MNEQPKFKNGDMVYDNYSADLGEVRRVLKPGLNPRSGKIENRYSVKWFMPFEHIQQPEYESELRLPKKAEETVS